MSMSMTLFYQPVHSNASKQRPQHVFILLPLVTTNTKVSGLSLLRRPRNPPTSTFTAHMVRAPNRKK